MLGAGDRTGGAELGPRSLAPDRDLGAQIAEGAPQRLAARALAAEQRHRKRPAEPQRAGDLLWRARPAEEVAEIGLLVPPGVAEQLDQAGEGSSIRVSALAKW